MPWFKVDDRFWSHPITSELSDSATALWIRAGSWSACHLTDGEIPKSKLKAFGSRMRAAQELVDAGLWSYSATSETFSIQNWAKYQPEKAQVLKKREDTKNRVNAYRNKDSNAVTDSVSNTSPDPTRTQPYIKPLSNSEELNVRKSEYSDDFETWWKSYPRRQAKGDAWKAWKSLKKVLPDVDTLVAASLAYEKTITDPQFLKMPGPWLRARRWEDVELQKTETVMVNPNIPNWDKPAPEGRKWWNDDLD